MTTDQALSDDDIEKRIGAVVRKYRGEMTQATLAERMRQHGFRKWSQSTVWSVERGDRSLKHSEALALTEVLGIVSWRFDAQDEEVTLRLAMAEASRLWQEIKTLTTEFKEAQAAIAVSLHYAAEKGLPLPAGMAVGGGWLESGPVQAAREAEYEYENADDQSVAASDFAHRPGAD